MHEPSDRLLKGNALRQFFERNTTNHIWKKTAKTLIRPADKNETVLTIVDGKLESFSTAKDDDSFIAQNITVGTSGEQYVIDYDTFINRYKMIDKTIYTIGGKKWHMFESVGKVTGFFHMGKPFQMKGSWGNNVQVETGDFIARPVNGNDPSDIYRIEREIFFLTYTRHGVFNKENN